MRTVGERFGLAGLLVIAAGVFFTGIKWGLPSRAADPYLFGGRHSWTGQQIIALAGGWESNPDIGADVAINPLEHRGRVMVVNDTDARRAEIVRRYRLFSCQPDEMITLRALAGMKPGRLQLDPRLYQYGGLWIYPVGALLRLASSFHLIEIRSDVAHYLDYPEQFGRFYVVARVYTALWALVGVATVFAIVRRLVGRWQVAIVAGACITMMPVVVNMSHEAKPHLPGAVLMLLAVLAGARYVETGVRRWGVAAGALCGAAVGMVISSVPVFGILPVMLLIRPSSWPAKMKLLLASTFVGVGLYVVTNPYVPINLVRNRAVLRSNFGNSTAMYHAGLSLAGIANALELIAVGTGPLLALAGGIGAIALAARAIKVRHDNSDAEVRRRATGLLLAVPAIWVAGQCAVLAAGKPAEFARFAILPDVALMIEAVVAVATFVRSPKAAGVLLAGLWITTAIPGSLYLRGFIRDSRPITSRLRLAEVFRQLESGPEQSMAIYAEPAPYCQPPVDLWRWKLLLMPREMPASKGEAAADVAIWTSDVTPGSDGWGWIFGTPISWADKPFEIDMRVDPAYAHP